MEQGRKNGKLVSRRKARRARQPSGGRAPRKPVQRSERIRRKPPEDVRALVDAVFARHDLVRVASDLLICDKPSVSARVLEKLLEYRFGRPTQMIETTGPGGGPVCVVIVSHIPRPARSTPEATRSMDDRSK